MTKRIINSINNYFKGHERTVKAKKNIIASFGLKGISILISFLYVPLLLNYLDKERYGIWLTLTSVITWFNFFDFGLGSGLRNKFAEAKAINNTKLAKEYVSTTYAILIVVFAIILSLFYLINPFLNWAKILNTNPIFIHELSLLAIIVFTFFVFRFIAKLIGQILLADQKPAVNNSFMPISNIICLLFIIVLIKVDNNGSLILAGSILSIVPVIVLLIASIILFSSQYKEYTPSIKNINLKHTKDLLGLGVKFFIIHISTLVIYQSQNLLITHICGPEEVTVYNIAYKYFNLFIMVFSIILTPIWSATTEAFAIKDYNWIKNIMRRLRQIGILLVIGVIIAFILSNYFYRFWIGDQITIPFSISGSVAIVTIVYLLFSPYVSFLNGVSKIKLNIILVIFQTLIYIPIAIYLGKKIGVAGIVLSGLICELPLRITQPLQYKKIISGKAKGIWNQ